MSVLKKVLLGVAATGVLVPSLAFAQTSTTSASVQATLSQIQALETQIKALQEQHKKLLEQYQLLATQQNQAFIELLTTLKEGSAGDQVAVLQALLALDSSIYPEGAITGYFGRLTAQAVKRFQKKHGLEQVGFVGPKTLKKLNEILREIEDDDEDDEDDRDHGKNKVTICHKGQTITVGRSALFAHVKHGDSLGNCAGGGGTGTTTPPTNDTTPPVLSTIGVTGITTTGATINWTTNEGASTQVLYGTSSSYTASTTVVLAFTTGHSVALLGLTPNTVYHFAVVSKDAAGNQSTSGDMTFTTSVVADTTAPIISSVSVSGLGSTTATVAWTTNENATGKITYGTSSVLSGASEQSSLALTTGHSFNLTGLTATTTYFYRLESKDAVNNTATTSIQSFTTVN